MNDSLISRQQELYIDITAYLQHINFARNCLTAYTALYDNIQNNDQILNHAAGFFTITQYALSKCLLLELAKLFCGSRKERTIQKLMGIVQANQDAFINGNIQIFLKRFQLELEGVSSIISKLKTRRNQDLTHNDPIFFHGDINPAEEQYISPNECRQLIDLVFSLCQDLLDCLPIFDSILLNTGADDFNAFIDIIKQSGCFDKQ